MKISKKMARAVAITAAGLSRNAPFGRGKAGVFRAISHLGYVQIDTISVVQRAHHHVLASRIPNYRKSFLFSLQEQSEIFEYWAHAAAYLPMKDYRFSLPVQEYFRLHKDPWPKSDKKLMQKVYDQIKLEGPMMARDFQGDRKRKAEGWWDWKPAKLALERHFLEGTLMTVGRRGFQKIYDLPENVVPSHIEINAPDDAEFAEYLIQRSLQSLGLATVKEICYLRKGIKAAVERILDEKINLGEIRKIEVEGIKNQRYFARTIDLESNYRIQKNVHILSPFDNFTIQRQRMEGLFDFNYQIESYVPAAKRIYGYFCLPVLYGDQFVARMDAKADRPNGTLLVKNLHFEKTRYHRIPMQKWVHALNVFAAFNQCDRIVFDKCNDMVTLSKIDKSIN